MSGPAALGYQLTELGGRLFWIAQTAPRYRLRALEHRPGTLPTSGGAAIEWALPTAALGTLLAQVPPLLGLGTTELSDGLCLAPLTEAEQVTTPPDISNGGCCRWLAEKEFI
jgi:allophanate hydrolase